MERLSYRTLESAGYTGYLLRRAPERVLQFGEGNFLRGFAEDFIDRMNERAGFCGKVVAVQPRAPKYDAKGTARDTAAALNEQEGLYTLYLRGAGEGSGEKLVISCVSRCLNAYADFGQVMECAASPALRFIISNTTEAGIRYDPACRLEDAPAESYPGKLTQFLYRRFRLFGRERGKGFFVLPCELIEDNGAALRGCVLAYARQWGLGEAFIRWLEEENYFCSTLVDRIVTGFPAAEAGRMEAENGYEDRAIDTGEPYASWVIEGPEALGRELPFAEAGLPVRLTGDLAAYRRQKVRLLNGAHSAVAAGAYLAGCATVAECMDRQTVRRFLERTLFEELLPSLGEEPDPAGAAKGVRAEAGPAAPGGSRAFAQAVLERFSNPYIGHRLEAIALNYTAKWRTRLLPAVKEYTAARGAVPPCLAASFAFYLEFCRRGRRMGRLRDGQGPEGAGEAAGEAAGTPVSDDPGVLEFFEAHATDSPRALTDAACRQRGFWGEELTVIPGFADLAAAFLEKLEEEGAEALMAFVLHGETKRETKNGDGTERRVL